MEVKLKALVCGNALCFIEETKGKNFTDYFVIRMNGFISTTEFPFCDAWSSWPNPTHRLKHDRCEPMYDVAKYASKSKELWLVHPNFILLAINKFKRDPDYVLPSSNIKTIFGKFNSAPNMGMLMIMACLCQERFTEIYVAGFDFYESKNDYYFIDGKFDHPAHNQEDNKKWFTNQLKYNNIRRLD